jgi:dihydroorotate dehydrogenase
MINNLLICCLTLCSCVALSAGFDTDGHYLRQALLVFAGYTIAGVFFLINSTEE